MEASEVMGVPKNGWFISWKIPQNKFWMISGYVPKPPIEDPFSMVLIMWKSQTKPWFLGGCLMLGDTMGKGLISKKGLMI